MPYLGLMTGRAPRFNWRGNTIGEPTTESRVRLHTTSRLIIRVPIIVVSSDNSGLDRRQPDWLL